ncbi:hypothetical protein Ddc_01593 [Ditylenchus destructor]|nr:hypothetical protein Ddc_01593 [Ditylenchus destructor]
MSSSEIQTEMENKLQVASSGQAASQYAETEHEDEETDEFVVIQEFSPRANALDGMDSLENGQRIRYVDKSHTVSECGPDVADVGDGLDCGKSMCSSSGKESSPSAMNTSMISGRSQHILDSMYLSMYGAPYGDTSQMEAKLAEVVRAEQEKSRATLDQIMSMVAELTKEKTDNSELRDKLSIYASQVEKSEQRTKDLQDTTHELKAKINKDAEERARLVDKLDRLRAAYANRDSEADDLEEKYKRMCLENAHLKKALEEAEEEIKHKTVDTANQSEIINVLQEEVVESSKMVVETRKKYHERLNTLEEQIASYHQRNEVNFP